MAPLARYKDLLHSGHKLSFTTKVLTFQLNIRPLTGYADGFKMALLDLDERLKAMDVRIVHTMQDEIIIEAKDEIAEEVAGILEECMITPFGALIPSVPFEVELKIQDSWEV